ncbi:MAG: hypothetical protein J5648_09355 [Lachnospiraceae bacterium]|nr:hypothetical protein [Lachnospiraceae bacterium]
MKLRYMRIHVWVFFGVFIISLALFYGTLDNHVLVNEFHTVRSVDATLPVISFETSGAEINRTLGYTFIPQEGKMRESITPVSPTNRTFTVLVDEKDSNVRKIGCTVSEVVTGVVLDNIELMSLKRTSDGRLSGQFFLSANYATNTEYTMRITITTSEGKVAYYYTRLFLPTYGNPKREVEFLENFHEAILTEDRRTEVEKYLETEDGYTGSDFSRITHRDTVDSVGYGQMEPKEVETFVPRFVEYTTQYVAAEKEFYVEAYSNDGLETYACVEHYRFRTETKTNYLFSFERKMEVVFSPEYFNLSQQQIKLGITGEQKLNALLSDNEKYLLFVRDGDLWEYDMAENVMIPLFSFDREGGDNERYHNRNHNFRLISVDDKGNADFVFYGYIIRGEYEGRVGILYYRYYAEEQRVEELMFAPVTVPYDILKEEFGDICYMNKFDEFFFTLYGTLYRYRTTLHDTVIVAENMHEPFYLDGSRLVYQEAENDVNTRIVYYDLEANTTDYREADEGDLVLFLGSIDGDLIYGDAHKSDLSFKDNGQPHVPMYRIRIENSDDELLKTYVREHPDEYYLDAELSDYGLALNINKKTGTVSGVKKDGTAFTHVTYEDIGTYNILKSTEPKTERVKLSTRYSEPMRREYYLNLPASFKLSVVPTMISVKNTQGSGRTPVRTSERSVPVYYVEAFGKVISVSEDLAYCVSYANANYGGVFDERGQIVWLRGMRANSALLRNVTPTFTNDTIGEKEAVLQILLSYKGAAVNAWDCNLDEKGMLAWVDENIPGKAVDLTGVTMMEALNFVSDGHLLVTYLDDHWMVVIGYTANIVHVISPGEGRQRTILLSRMRNTLDNHGIFYTYID